MQQDAAYHIIQWLPLQGSTLKSWSIQNLKTFAASQSISSEQMPNSFSVD